MNDESSFYISLHSESSLQYYPGNKPSDFVNRLHKPLSCGPGFEVGICDVFFAPGNETESDCSQEVQKTIKVTTGKKDHQQISVAKKGPRLLDWIKEINSSLKVNNLTGLKLVYHVDPKYKTERVKIINTLTAFSYVTFSDNALNIFGFNTEVDGRKFPMGTYESDNLSSEILYHQLNEPLIIRFVIEPKSEQVNISLRVGEGSKQIVDPHDLINNINRALQEKSIPIEYALDEHDVTIEVQSKDKSNRIEMSRELNLLFGLEWNHVFQGKEEYAFSASKINFVRGHERLIFLSNVVKNQYYGDSMRNVLRITSTPKKSTENKEVHLQFQPVIYLPLASTPIPQISVKIMTESGDFASVSSSHPLAIILHVRRSR